MTDLNVKKTINHLFRGSSWLLVSQIIPTIIKYSKFKHHFIININEFGLQEKYDTLFGNLGYTDYEYWGALCPANKYFTQKKVNFFAKLKSRYRAYLSAKKMSNIIIHSEMNNSIFYFLHTPESAWCCWGNTSQIRHTKWYHFFYKDFWYKLFLDRCKIIITLTDLDKKAFEDAYGYSKIIISSYSYIYMTLKRLSLEKNIVVIEF